MKQLKKNMFISKVINKKLQLKFITDYNYLINTVYLKSKSLQDLIMCVC